MSYQLTYIIQLLQGILHQLQFLKKKFKNKKQEFGVFINRSDMFHQIKNKEIKKVYLNYYQKNFQE